MPNILLLGHVDTWALAGSLRSKIGLFKEGTPRVVAVRAPRRGTEAADEDFVSYKETMWPELRNMIALLRRKAEAAVGEIELGLVSLEQLDPGAIVPWHTESGAYAERFTRAHLALRTNPGALVYCGPEAIHMAPGFLNAINMLAPTSQVNFGEHPRIHLIVDFRRKEPT